MTGDRLRVLLVEDSEGEAELIETLLRSARGVTFDVTHVVRLGDALPLLVKEEWDAVLLDFNLPDSAGLETYERASEVAPDVPVIILTNLKDEEMAVRAVRAGAQDYLVKREVDGNLLGRAIRYAVERQRSETALRESEERYALAVRGASDGIWDWDLRGGRLYLSARWKEMLGYEEEEIGSDPEEWFSRVHPDDLGPLRSALAAHLDGTSRHFEREYRIRSADGEYRWVVTRGLAVIDDNGRPMRMAGSLADITLRRRAEERLLHDAFHDHLTGLPNRTLFLDRVGTSLRQIVRRPARNFAVLFCDLDRFKTVNDSLGHEGGDVLLRGVAECLEELVRPGDTVARLGGDEFGMLVSGVDGAGHATHLAERVHAALRKPLMVLGREVFTSVSIGIVVSSDSYKRPEELLRDADMAMYRAKLEGRSRTEVFDQDMHRAAVALLQLETDLRRAVERHEFVMNYQPIVSLSSGRIMGFEGLVRWAHPTRGLMSPTQFLGVAEETGLIVPIGWWVLEEACRQMGEWQRRYPMTPPLAMSVNVSGRLFSSADMVDRVVAALEAARLDPSSLRLEITETIIMDHGEPVLERLAELRALGVQLHIDDFGTGYSSLAYLQRFRYDTLKIDRSFVGSLTEQGDGGAIVQTIVALAHLLNMNVIAEGVETVEQFQKLREMRCPQGQGFWFARPLDLAGAEALLEHGAVW